MSDRILGAACLVVAAGMAWAAQDYAAPISYEPVGPRAFPLLLAGTTNRRLFHSFHDTWNGGDSFTLQVGYDTGPNPAPCD